MEDKIAVQCNTEDEWRKVKKKAGFSLPFPLPEREGEPLSITIGGGYNGGHGGNKCNIDLGYTIISAAEYLNEGGKDVSEFKVGDRVEITEIQDGEDYVGERLKITTVHSASGISVTCRTPEGHTWYFSHGNFKALTNKSKENKMNTNISEVFDKTKDALLVEKHLGSQLGTTFIDGLILADKKTEVLAEAKRLEKEEKEEKKRSINGS